MMFPNAFKGVKKIWLAELLMLLAASRFAGYPPNRGRCVLGAVLGGVHAGACTVPALVFLGNGCWRLVFLTLVSITAYGFGRQALRRSALYVFLSLALGGFAMGLEQAGPVTVLLGASGMWVLCALGLPEGGQEFVEVQLRRGENREKLLALRDTGNTLRDPVTGQRVLVADARSAFALLGLEPGQLANPVETVASGVIPGLRLIPYRTVGRASGLLVAIRMEQVRIGAWEGSSLVAFAPSGLGECGVYRALTGGIP
jgi:stage II sporulation protein GA (sporulation sigma-E factor processing peptidase)